jgi:serine/threonine-protein kinase
MSHVPGEQAAGSVVRRRWWWQRQLWKEETQAALLPALGSTVGGYHLEAKLGKGGQGTVYRARRGGQLYAVKFIYLPIAGKWARRELETLPRLEKVGVVRLEGYGKWPDVCPFFLFIAMEYVPGLPLYAWARKHPPTARQVAQVLVELARQLAAIHAEGVVHRDVKGANVLVRPEGQPVLVDFGVSTWPTAPRVTGPFPPGSWPYRSPELWRFLRERQPGERYTSSPLEDLWALGIVLYRLLTGAYPFDEPDEPSQQDAVLTHHPQPPHVRTPRVPKALSELCLRLLDKAPEARFHSAGALEEALAKLLAEADAAWDVPLREAPTQQDAPEELPTPQPPTRAAPSSSAHEALPVQHPIPPPTRPARWLGWALGCMVGLLLAQGIPALHRATRAPAPTASAPPAPHLEWRGAPGQEVAPEWKWPEGGQGTVPPKAATPVPVASATRPQDMRVKTPPVPPASQHTPQAKKTDAPSAKVGTALLVCTVAFGCPAAQVRPETPADCPPGAEQAMEEWGIWGEVRANFTGEPGLFTVHHGQRASFHLNERWGKAQGDTVFTGELRIGKERIYGLLTEARTEEGNSFPVCVQLVGNDDQLGLRIKERPAPDTASASTNMGLKAVRK